MKKTKWKKLLAVVVLVSIVIFTFSGCENKSSSESSSSSSEVQSDALSNTDGDEPFEFTFCGPIWEPYKETTHIFDELMKETNTTINFDWIQQDGFSTQLAAKIASGNIPDVIKTTSDVSVESLIDSGVVIPITDYLKTDMPNYTSKLSDSDYVYLENANDNEIYGFGMMMDVPGAYSTAIRTDWLKNLNLDMPETWEDWVNVWYAFKEQDANGNGDASDEIPFTVRYDQMYLLLDVFGIESNGSFSVVDGEYVYDPENENYELFLDTMRQLYADGIFNKEFVTCDSTAINTMGANNTLGSMINWAEQAKNYSVSCAEIDDDALFNCVVPISGPNGDQSIMARSKLTVDTYLTAEASDSGKVEGIMKFFNYVFGDDGVQLTNFGVEGTDFEIVNGEKQLLAPNNESFTAARTNGLIPTTIPFYFSKDLYMNILMGGLTYDDLDEYGKSFVDGLTVNDPYYYYAAPVLKTDAYMNSTDLMEQQTSLRDKYIMGQISKDEYNSQYEALKKAGLNDVIEQAKETYKSLNS